jgi:NADPH2:quinone reductase
MHRYGGPDVLVVDEVPTPSPGPGEVRIVVSRAGVNFTDTYRRSGFYPVALPYIPGVEAVGVVDEVGARVSGVKLGDRVAFPQSPSAYAEAVVASVRDVVTVPDHGLLDDDVCALMMQGLTAHYLATSTVPLVSGDTVVVLAAAGGVGRLLVQVARIRGARVLGVVSTEAKANVAIAAGADEVLVSPGDQLARLVMDLTGGLGARAVYDAVGLATFRQSMAAVRAGGTLVLYGQASGPVPPFDTLALAERSIYLTRPRLRPHIEDRKELERRTRDLFAWARSGAVTTRVDRVMALDQAATAHAYLESGSTTGKVLLAPGWSR